MAPAAVPLVGAVPALAAVKQGAAVRAARPPLVREVRRMLGPASRGAIAPATRPTNVTPMPSPAPPGARSVRSAETNRIRPRAVLRRGVRREQSMTKPLAPMELAALSRPRPAARPAAMVQLVRVRVAALKHPAEQPAATVPTSIAMAPLAPPRLRAAWPAPPATTAHAHLATVPADSAVPPAPRTPMVSAAPPARWGAPAAASTPAPTAATVAAAAWLAARTRSARRRRARVAGCCGLV